MPSLFSRSHQAPKKDRGPAVLVSNSTAGDRRLLGLAKTWSGQPAAGLAPSSSVGEFGTVPSTTSLVDPDVFPGQGCVFLTTNVPIGSQSILSSETVRDETRTYGFLGGCGGKNVVLGLDEVARVIRDVGAELAQRALNTPMLFSNQSLELNQMRMRMLVQTFLGTVRTPTRIPTRTSVDTFAQDIQFASDHELAWLLRWSLSRLTRIREATHEVCHGCIDWEQYEEWRGRERASKYPSDAFSIMESILAEDITTHIINPLLSLLSKFAAHSHISGLTPHALASYFAPLLFDIPTSSGYLAAHTAFVRAAGATEHLLLAYIRSSGDHDGLGVTDLPFRLKEWVKGYPSMLATDGDLARGKPRRGARTVKCEVATRSVRAYSRDLFLSAETWAQDIPTGWESWDRVVLKSRRGEAARPKFSAGWRRRMVVKEMLPLPQSRHNNEKIVYGLPVGGRGREKKNEDEADAGRYASMAGKEWSAFEEGGFDAPRTGGVGSREETPTGDIRTRLQFDLNESAKLSVAERRQTMDWGDFADGGFTRTEPFLTASLTFSAPVQTSITEWPKERDELRRRLHKTQKEATPFNYDTTPRVGPAAHYEGADNAGRVTIEEAFVDCWTDFLIGTAWMDRDELTFKESSWALIEYKARPVRPEESDDAGADPRTSELYFLFEERVPLEYQMAVADPKRKKSLHSIFSKKKKSSAPPPSGPWSPGSAQRTDIDKMLERQAPKKVPLTRDHSVSSSLWQSLSERPQPPSAPSTTSVARSTTVSKPVPTVPSAPKALKSGTTPPPDTKAEEQAKLGSGKPSRIFKSIRRVKSGSDNRAARKQQQREVSMDFELHSASGLSSGTSSPQDKKTNGVPGEDKWMDILVANGARKMSRDDASPNIVAHASGPPSPLNRKLSTPTPTNETITPAVPGFIGAATGLGLQPPALADRCSSTSSQKSTTSETQKRSVSGSSHRSSNGSPKGSPKGIAPAIESPHDPALFGDHSPPGSQSSADRSPHGLRPASSSNSDDASVLPSDSISMRRGTFSSPPESPTTPVMASTPPILPTLPGASSNSSYEGVLSPKPRPAGQRDAIVSIVDHYSGAAAAEPIRDSVGTEYSEDEAYAGMARDSFIERTYASERVNSAYSLEEDLRQPPPIFDLTPGREPSPARYKHGEPLHFVGEEEEEEEEEYVPPVEHKVDDYSLRARRF